MNRLLLTCVMAVACPSAFAQTGTVHLWDEAGVPTAPGFGGAPGATPGGFESPEDALRRRLAEAFQARIGQMTSEQLRRALAVIDSEATPLPAAAEEVLEAYRQQAGAIQRAADRKIAVHRKQAIADLREIQDRLTRDGQLDEAVAVRDLIRSLAVPPANVLADPGTLFNFRDRQGRPLYFRVTGNTLGSVWGTDVYTDDSRLAAAAVHAGALQNGQTGIVKVTLLPGINSYAGSTRNGVTTSQWGTYSGSYRVEAVRPDDVLEPGDAEPPAEAEPPASEPGANAPAAEPLSGTALDE